ncbi:MAG: peptidase M20 [Chloroflexi bacterium HGW-Chloroflexi-4]|jgi:acetylornithine deacetylase/succinyl-diaminopimelate desuccinylase-like protein|nr:MAG: peptidase M20 [Chloroflexi bacterium HGW-Chloroflexi-4]
MSDSHLSEISRQAKTIQAISSLTFFEQKRGEYLAAQFSTLGLQDVHKDSIGNVFARIKGGYSLPLVITAHLDSVLTPDGNNPLIEVDKHLIGPGIGDNALGVAMLIEIGRALRERSNTPSGDIWLVGNVGEEGLGNLKGMHQVVEKFNGKVKAYLVLEGIGLGMIQTAALGVHRYKIEVNTKGGHSWSNFGEPSAIHELITLSAKILTLNLPVNPRSSINIGEISGGGSINSIASHAEMQIEIRSEDESILESLARTIHKITHQNPTTRSNFIISDIGMRPSGRISDSSPVIIAAQAALRSTGITPVFAISSSDASLPISLGYQATCLGITTGRHVHTPHETIDLNAISKGTAQVFHFIDHLWDY